MGSTTVAIDAGEPERPRRGREGALAGSRADLQRLADWAISLESEGLVSLSTYRQNRMILLPRLRDEKVGLVTLWNDSGPSMQIWRTVFERRAPEFIEPVGSGRR